MAGRLNLRQSGPFVGLAGMATTFFLYAWSALVVPGLATRLALPLLWLALTVLAGAWFTRRPYAVLVLPVVATAAWFAVLLTRG